MIDISECQLRFLRNYITQFLNVLTKCTIQLRQIGIKIQDTFPFCGGTIIGPTTILTAAHCLETQGLKPKYVTILVAEHDWTTNNETFS